MENQLATTMKQKQQRTKQRSSNMQTMRRQMRTAQRPKFFSLKGTMTGTTINRKQAQETTVPTTNRMTMTSLVMLAINRVTCQEIVHCSRELMMIIKIVTDKCILNKFKTLQKMIRKKLQNTVKATFFVLHNCFRGSATVRQLSSAKQKTQSEE